MAAGFGEDDRKVNAFILTLEGLPDIGAGAVRDYLVKHCEAIKSAEVLDGAFALSLNESRINKALTGGTQKDSTDDAQSIWNEHEEIAGRIIERAISRDISILNPYMDEYPQRLLFNKKYPPILFVRGNAEILNCEKSVAIIGTREPTDFGKRMGHRLAELLVEDGYVIVSGLAVGCDTVGHEGALDAGGKTVAVLPTPIDAPVYPKQNQELADRIVDTGGVLVSEYAPGVELHDKQLVSNLVARDEWQPGLSDGVIAIETSRTGGTNHALDHAESTKTPIAVFDYRTRTKVDFLNEERYGGNVDRINSGATAIFEESTIEDFKEEMKRYRNAHKDEKSVPSNEDLQLDLGF